MPDQPPLFDNLGEAIPAELALTLTDGPLANAARVGFLTGMLAVWYANDAKPTPFQKERFRQIAVATLEQAVEVTR